MAFRSDRRQLLLEGLDLSRTGAEYGPLTCPIVRKTDGPVIYIDYADVEGLRAQHTGVDASAIVDIDHIWGSVPLRETGRFHYVVASHVIEHVPDAIGWLSEIADALDDDGIIALAIPDKRYTFDIRHSTVAIHDRRSRRSVS